MSLRADRNARLKAEILTETRRVVERDGASGVTVKAIAAAVGYSAPVIYQHFTDKEALLTEVIRTGFDELEAAMRAPSHPGGKERVLEVAWAYLDFAARAGHTYELMNGTGGVDLDPARRQEAAAGVIACTYEVMAWWADSEALTPPELADWCDTAWGLLHGMATLGQIDAIGPERAWKLTVDAFEALMAHWRKTAA